MASNAPLLEGHAGHDVAVSGFALAAAVKLRKHAPERLAFHPHVRRSLSMFAGEQIAVGSRVNDTISENEAVFAVVNFLLGTAPLTMPYAFAQAGILLSASFLVACAGLAYVTSTYVIETLALASALVYEGAEARLWTEEEESGKLRRAPTEEDRRRLLEALRREQPEHVFKIRAMLGYGELGGRMLPKAASFLLYVTVLVYSFGACCVTAVNIILTFGTIVPQVRGATYSLLGVDVSGHSVLVLLFVVIVYPLCFTSLQRLASQQFFWLVVKFCALGAIILCSAYQAWGNMSRDPNGNDPSAPVAPELPPLADFSALPLLFGNAVLAFMLHHSIPGLLAPLGVQSVAPRVIRKGYAISLIVQIVIGSAAVGAFGKGVLPLYTLSFADFPVPYVGAAISAYPATLVSLYPFTAITCRNNLTAFLGLPKMNPERPCTLSNIFATSCVVLVPAAVASITDNVQAIVSLTAGYMGLSLTFLWPCLLVVFGRRVLSLEIDVAFDLKSPFVSKAALCLVMLFWAGAIAFNTYKLLLAP